MAVVIHLKIRRIILEIYEGPRQCYIDFDISAGEANQFLNHREVLKSNREA